MKRSENSCSSWSTRIVCFFLMTSAVVGVIAVAVPIQIVCPARHPSPKKIAWSQNRHDCLFADLIDNRESHTALLNVHHMLGGVALRKYGLFSSKFCDFSRHAGRIEKSLDVERGLFLGFYTA